MPRNLDTGLLRTFVTVADMASMTAAANALHLTQGAVSQQIRRLEETFDSALFERDRRGLKLTNDGERLLGRARQLLGLNDEIWAAMTTSDITGEVRLGAPYDLVGTYLPPALKAFALSHPQVNLSLVCAASPQLADALDAGAIDLAVIEEPAGPSSGECLNVERLVWVGSRGGSTYLKRPLPLSVVSDTCAFRPAVFAALHQHGVQWRTVFDNGNIEATIATVRMDLAVTAWLASTVPADLDVLGPDSGLPALPSFAINLHLPRSGASRGVSELARHLREAFAQPPRSHQVR
ncbi:MAG TPA: LysR family transcriptional regulator [Vineibacter sp.]|nr:LysR family transcriptional regulator [Vineibacter sp.]